MSAHPSTRGRSGMFDGLLLVAAAVILKVTATILIGYRDYLPPDFASLFLGGRDAYFWDGYHIAFYAHILAGPITLVVGLLLLSGRFLRRFPRWHRRLGRLQVICVLLLLTPSGLWMAFYAESGPIAGAGFGLLALATALCIVMGWRSAIRRQFAVHRRWMTRCYILLCSAVVLRLLGGIALLAGSTADWPYQLSAWVSWLVPLAIYEVLCGRSVDHVRGGWGAGRSPSRMLS